MRRISVAPRKRNADAAVFRRRLATTTVANFVSVAAAGATGILITRSMGTADRGAYAAIMSWFSAALVIGELGQTAATTFYVAGDPTNARGYVATSRNLMAMSGLPTMIIGLSLSPLLSRGDHVLQLGYVLMFVTCVFGYLGASFTFSLQAAATTHWNIVRVFQPLFFAVAVGALHFGDSVSLLTCLYASSMTISLQTLLAYFLCRRNDLTHGKATLGAAKRMTRFGLHQMAGAIPALLVGRLDQLALSLVSDRVLLGHYAAASSLTSVSLPIVSAIGSVIFPRIAFEKHKDLGATYALQKRALTVTVLLSAVVASTLVLSARRLVPFLFGVDYRPASSLVFVLAPGAAMLACSQVCGDVLRGHGLPLAVARTQWTATACSVVLVILLVHPLGAMGAAIAMTGASSVSLATLLMELHKLKSSEPARRNNTPAGASAENETA